MTGGRGPVKKTAEFIWECQRLKVPYTLIADSRLTPILEEMNIKPDYSIAIDFSSGNDVIYAQFERLMKDISFDLLVKFGARTPGPYCAMKLGKPYIIIDGGLPDKFESYPSLYDKGTYQKASLIIVTSNFPWIPIKPLFLDNVQVAYFPLSEKSKDFIKKIKLRPAKELISKYQKYFTPFDQTTQLRVNLMMTNDYVETKSRVKYGAWLTAKQYDQCVGFVRRLLSDLGETGKRIEVFTDKKISTVVRDILDQYKNVSLVTWKDQWNYEAEIMLDLLSDITISRAANYQPFTFAFCRGNGVTTAVPANGYMNEDAAAIQAQARGLTENIVYDDEQYIDRLLAFNADQNKQKKIAKKLKNNFETFGRENNSLTILFTIINSL